MSAEDCEIGHCGARAVRGKGTEEKQWGRACALLRNWRVRNPSSPMLLGRFLVQDSLENSRGPSLPPNAHSHVGMPFHEVC